MRKTPPLFIKGDNWIICDRTGFRVRVSDSVEDWNGLRVGKKYSEQRNPQDFLRVKPDNMAARIVRPEGQDVFIEQNVNLFSFSEGFSIGFES